jgi:signal transduction histidine kinase
MEKFLKDNLLSSKLKIQELKYDTSSRILICYFFLTLGFIGITIPIFSKLVIQQTDRRVIEDLDEEIEVFRDLLAEEEEIKNVTRMEKFFRNYLRYKIPGDKTFLIAITNNDKYRSSPISVPTFLESKSNFIRNMTTVTEFVSGSRRIADNFIYYQAQPVIYQGQTLGILVVVTIPEGERQEVIDAIILVIKSLIIAWLITLLIIYKMTGIILKPIRNLIETSQEISEKQLNYRMVVQGKGEMVKLAETFNNMMERLETAFKNQNQLLNDVSHELRTPITIVRGHLELLDYDSEAERQVSINLVLEELDRMAVLVDELLLLAKAEQEKFLKLEKVDLRQFIEEIYQKVKILKLRNWQLVNCKPITMTIDRQKMTQALMNLIENAVRYTDPGDTITIIVKVSDRRVYLGVQDIGIGIPQPEQHKVFDRFFRASNSRCGDEKGAGLGLSIVKAIIEKHHGTIEVYSKLGEGSIFYLVLPMPTNDNGGSYESNFDS